MLAAAVKMSKSDDSSCLAAFGERHGGVRVSEGPVAVHVADAQGTDQMAAAEHHDMAVKVAARLMPRADGIAWDSAFAIASPGVLHAEVLLALSFQIVHHIQVLRPHPAQEHVII